MKVLFETANKAMAEYLISQEFQPVVVQDEDGFARWYFANTDALRSAIDYLQEKFFVAIMRPVCERHRPLTKGV